MFSIKQVANNLNMSTQAIYKQKNELINKGYMEQNDKGNWEINNEGFNYLKDKKINYMQQHNNQPMQPVANQVDNQEEKKESRGAVDIENTDKVNDIGVANILINHYKEQLQTVANQLQEMTEQRNYFKLKFEEKDNLCNQYMNSHLLPPTEDEARAKQEDTKQSIFKRIFSKNN